MRKNIVLFINGVPKDAVDSLRKYSKQKKQPIRIAVLRNSKRRISKADQKRLKERADILLKADFARPLQIIKVLNPFQDHLLAMTARMGEENVVDMAHLVPFVPYLRTPTKDSLLWSVDKLMMRKRFRAYDKKITPSFTVVSDMKKGTLEKIKERVGFPLILKPADLTASLLVNICFHEDELKSTLSKTLRKIKQAYKEHKRKTEPKILVEQFMEGEMYSIDGYVNSRGSLYWCPMVHVKTGKAIGFDDFFGYQQMTPTSLKKESIRHAEAAATKAVHALALRSSTVHVELIRTEHGWKVIELGPRLGGFRNEMYRQSYGIDHGLNDILIRIPELPRVRRSIKGYSAVMKIFAKKEGKLTQLKGVRRIKKLKSVVGVNVNKKIGDICKFAKHGGKSVVNVHLFHKTKAGLLADIRRVEQTLVISTG
ncbi:MAG: ATP-grasp domain-containing protein [Candidatus Harrisonbacteria bacterium]|nr:ATP-grasp domain-containing protein [Candidatus Harrisonbacteria bacterium]